MHRSVLSPPPSSIRIGVYGAPQSRKEILLSSLHHFVSLPSQQKQTALFHDFQPSSSSDDQSTPDDNGEGASQHMAHESSESRGVVDVTMDKESAPPSSSSDPNFSFFEDLYVSLTEHGALYSEVAFPTRTNFRIESGECGDEGANAFDVDVVNCWHLCGSQVGEDGKKKAVMEFVDRDFLSCDAFLVAFDTANLSTFDAAKTLIAALQRLGSMKGKDDNNGAQPHEEFFDDPIIAAVGLAESGGDRKRQCRAVDRGLYLELTTLLGVPVFEITLPSRPLRRVPLIDDREDTAGYRDELRVLMEQVVEVVVQRRMVLI